MVTSHSVSVSLVDAQTREPFKEHQTSDGKVYAEVEPKVEYFIQVKNESLEETVVGEMAVDGMDLGYKFYLRAGNQERYGIWSRKDGVSKDIALRFKRQSAMTSSSSDDGFWTGSVEVKLFKAGSPYMTPYKDVESKWTESTIHPPPTNQLKKKGVNSSEGSTVLEQRVDSEKESFRFFEKGPLITSIKLHYCTAVGLIYAGILPKPPLLEFHRMMRPWTEEDLEDDGDRRHLKVKPVVKTCPVEFDGRVLNEMTYVMFDLSDL